MAMRIAEKLVGITTDLKILFVLKDRLANRSRIDSFSGIGDEKH
jgi:2-dehydro-3-deoxyphosphooctonate aldolase (KDO 8-P synthase)